MRLQEVQVAEAQKNLESYLYQNCDFRNLADNLIYSKITGVDSVDSRKGNTNLLYSKEYENYIFQFVAYGSSIKESEYLDFENEKQSLITLIDQELNNIN